MLLLVIVSGNGVLLLKMIVFSRPPSFLMSDFPTTACRIVLSLVLFTYAVFFGRPFPLPIRIRSSVVSAAVDCSRDNY